RQHPGVHQAVVHHRLRLDHRPGAVRDLVGPPRAPGAPLCVVEVADDGPGIEPGQAARVFDRFYRAEALGTGATPGTGLGLAIAAAIARAHDGRLELDTRPGAGCAFRLLLPAPCPTSDAPHETQDPGCPTGVSAGRR
ncbi:ATP-binding protein, partial [Streptomyces seoulensis]